MPRPQGRSMTSGPRTRAERRPGSARAALLALALAAAGLPAPVATAAARTDEASPQRAAGFKELRVGLRYDDLQGNPKYDCARNPAYEQQLDLARRSEPPEGDNANLLLALLRYGSCHLRNPLRETIAGEGVEQIQAEFGQEGRLSSAEVTFPQRAWAVVLAALTERYGRPRESRRPNDNLPVHDWLFESGSLRLVRKSANHGEPAVLLVLPQHVAPADFRPRLPRDDL